MRARVRRLVGLLLGTVLVGAVVTAVTAPGRAASPTPALVPPAIPDTGAYLGAYVSTSSPASPVHVAETQAFEQSVGRPLAIHDDFVAWNGFSIGPQQWVDARNGTIPLISWTCDTAGVGEILDGSQDAVIDRAAQSVKAYGHPIFVRFWWEMNLFVQPRNQQCSDALGPIGYIRAWRHVRDRFRAAGATNAAFVWTVSGHEVGAAADQFYPGDDAVDWVAIDAYSRTGAPRPITDMVGRFYREWSGRKPLMISETGVQGTPIEQAGWLSDTFRALPSLPSIKALLYEDDGTARFDYRLTGAPALAAFAQGGRSPWFRPVGARIPLSVDPVPAIELNPGDPVDVAVTAHGFPVPTLYAPSLPDGLRLVDDGDGIGHVVGTPSLHGPTTFKVVATSPEGSASTTVDLTVDGKPLITSTDPLEASTAVAMSYPVGVDAYPPADVTVTGLPRGFRYDADAHTIVGAPGPGEGGRYLLTITARNARGTSVRTLPLTVYDGPRVVTTDAVAAWVGRPLSFGVGTRGYPRPTVSLVGDVPSWIHVAPADDGRVVVSGTPPAPGVLTLVVELTTGDQVTDYNLLVTVHR